MIIDDVNDYPCIFPVLACEMELAAVYHRMPVREIVDVTVEDDALTDAFRILQIVTSFDKVADIVPNNYIIRVT